jgi:hypothetical protein
MLLAGVQLSLFGLCVHVWLLCGRVRVRVRVQVSGLYVTAAEGQPLTATATDPREVAGDGARWTLVDLNNACSLLGY